MKKFLFALFFIFLWAEICSADITVYPGSNINYKPGDLVNLYGSISGVDGSGSDISSCGLYDYQWIDMNSTWLDTTSAMGTGSTSTSFNGSFTYPTGQNTISLKLLVSIPIGVPCPFAAQSYSGIVNYYNPPANAWTDATYNPWDTVYLSGSLGPPVSCTTMFHYSWAQTAGTGVTISNALWSSVCTSNSFTGSSFIFPDIPVWESVEFELTAFTTGTQYTDRVVFTRRTPAPVVSTGWWSVGSSYILNQNEAENLFNDTGSISQIALRLDLTTDKISKTLSLNWNSVWGGGHVRYFLEYSTGAEFKNSRIFETTETNLYLPRDMVDKNSTSHYLRVRAWYGWKYSLYSNTTRYYNDDPLMLPKYRDFRLHLKFLDIFYAPDLLIEKHLKFIPKKYYTSYDFL